LNHFFKRVPALAYLEPHCYHAWLRVALQGIGKLQRKCKMSMLWLKKQTKLQIVSDFLEFIAW